jgi:hypothetical protein
LAIIERVPIEFADGFAGLLIRFHGYKTKPPRFSGEFVLDDFDINDRSNLSKQILQIEFGRSEGKISYV